MPFITNEHLEALIEMLESIGEHIEVKTKKQK